MTLTALLAAGLGIPSLSGGITTAAAAPGQLRAAAGTEAAQEAAVETGNPVEVLSLRDERDSTVANPDGTFTTTASVQPVRALKNGEWTDIDTTLVRQKDGSYVPKAAVTAMSFSGGGTTTFGTIQKDGRSLSLDWPDKLPEPQVEGSTATYADVMPGVDLQVTASAEGFSHLIVVKDAEAADNPDLSQLELPVSATSVDVQESEDGGLTATDTAGGTVFEAPAPLMWDSRQNAGDEPGAPSPSAEGPADDGIAETPPDGTRIADVDVQVSDDTLTLTPDNSLLTGDDTVYPVYIDPVVKTASRSGWTMVSSYYSSAEFWKFGGDEGVGRCPADVSARCASSNDVKRQFFAVPTAGFEGKDIIKAEFAVTMVHTYSTSAKSVQLGRVNSTGASGINSATNWGNQPSLKADLGSKSPTNPAGSCTSNNQNVRFDVQSTVQQAADKGWDTTTFRMRAGDEGEYSYWKRFCGNAQLEVTYNRPPLAPSMSDLTMSPGGKCEYGHADDHYVSSAPVLNATIKDYDHNDIAGKYESLKARFHVFWMNGTKQVDHYATTASHTTTGTGQTGSASFKYTVGSDLSTDSDAGFSLPSNVAIGWEVQGSDGTAWGSWSSTGAATRCEFIYDASAPSAPVITSAQYPDDGAWHAGVGDYGSFTLDSPSADVAQYKYRFKGGDWVTVATSTPGGPATVKFMPTSEQPWNLEAKAVDAAGNAQKTSMGYTFLVSDGRPPVGGWSLGDVKGSTSASGTGTSPNATPGSGVGFGAAPGPLGASDTYAALDGTERAYLDAGRHIVNTNAGFSVSAWVNLPEVPNRDETVISQDGTGLPGFDLGYDGDTRSWVFRTPFNDMESMGNWQVTGGKVVPGAWTHLVGSYDGVTRVMRLYVDGTAISTTVKRTTPWNAAGALQIGRRLALDGYTAHLKGGIADVQVYDRVVTGPESAELGGIVAQQLGYWDVDAAPSGIAPEAYGGTGLTLGGGASIYVPAPGCDPEADPECVESAPEEPMWGDGHLLLNGTDAYATRAAGLLSKQDSFALTARARLSSVSPTKDQTVLALSGARGSAITVGYSAVDSRWVLTTTDADSATPVTTTVKATGFLPSTGAKGDHLALIYSAVFGDVVLYVNGVESARAPWDNTWDFTTTSIQVGRKLTGATSGSFLSGAVDEVRLFQGALDASLVATVMVLADDTSVEATLP
ncbi:LamG-like jellyroll fold domain-containing protein [Streptomyces sp. NPDC088726]|uniref:LamG-like jellyroll fold domain-containing protein n=1 Tax=Streptomyces sp. NPDC088726 TaxID=3365874 RepID=UPI003827DDED